MTGISPGSTATEAIVKLFMFLLVATLIVGGIIHRDKVSEYYTELAGGSSGSGGGSSTVDSMRDMGKSSRGLLGR